MRKTSSAEVILTVMLLFFLGQAMAVDIGKLRDLAAKNNVTCILVFGDSSVDPGNNDYIPTSMKANFSPYGKDFFNGLPTGRFCNGRLATDFIAEAIGYSKAIPAFLDPKLRPHDILHGVSFASAASGYDDLTANLSNVLSFSKQLKHFMSYKIHLKKLVGEDEAEKIIRNAIFVISMGTNDFLQNYYLELVRSQQYTPEQYQNYLASLLFRDAKVLHRRGARRLIVVGVPPLGCMPLVKTLMNSETCVETYNKVSSSFNSKIKQKLTNLQATTGMKTAYVDAFEIVEDAIANPHKYGFSETSKGCCGSGTTEYGDTCKGMDTCGDESKYVFWDAVHPTQKMYQIIANRALESPSLQDFLS